MAGVAVPTGRPGAMAAAGVGVIPEDRHDSGCVLGMTVAENLALADPHVVARRGHARPAGAARSARPRLMSEFEITAPGPDTPMRLLSGGNQQRVVLARELSASPTVLVAAQPTHGLDVGAIEYMGGRLRAAAESGVGVLLISTELEEILALAHRIVRRAPGADRRRDDPRRGRPGAHRPAHGRGGGVREIEELPLAVVDAAPVIPGGPPRAAGARRRRHASRRTWSRSPSRSRSARCSSPRPAGRGRRSSPPCSTAACARPARGASRSTTAAPLLIVAVGTIIATKAGLVNIGQEGQLLIGASCCRVRRRPHPRPRLVRARWPRSPAGVVGGALWAGLAAGMRFWRQVPEVISTLLLVFVAFQLVAYGLTKTLAAARPHAPHQQEQHRRAAADRHARSATCDLFGNDVSLSVVARPGAGRR